MNKINYDRAMQEIIESLSGERKKLLLHCCCAPCSTACIERLKDFFDITLYFFNPNIDTKEEHDLRANELMKFASQTGLTCKVGQFIKQDFLDACKGLENEKEGGARCPKCFYLRLYSTAVIAKEEGFDYFTTTLTVSPLKNCAIINQIGEDIQNLVGINYLPSDFKKRNGYLRSIELSKEFELYRQNYCGCEFSKPKSE